MTDAPPPVPAVDPAAVRAIELAEAHEALTRSIARLTDHAELPGLMTTVLQEIVRASGAVSVAVFAYNAEKDELFNYAQLLRGEVLDVKTDPRVNVFATPTRATGNPAWEAMVQQQYFWVDYQDPDTRAGPQSTAWHRANGHGYVVCIPMLNGPQPVGFLGLAFDRSEVIRPTELRLERSRVLARQAALAMQFTRISEQAQAAALAEERRRAETARHAALLEERNRMAREIHDTFAQTFTGVMMQLRAAQSAIHVAENLNIDLIDGCLTRAESLAREGLRDARRSVMALRPDAAEYSDLLAKVRRLVEQTTSATPVNGEVHVKGQPVDVPPDTGFQLFRIVQEAVANALRHSQAKTLRVTLRYEPQTVELIVADDGRGFDAVLAEAQGGTGLRSMRHRVGQLAGRMTIDSQENSGTSLSVIVPLS